jgi:hypothetical protein
MSTINSRIDAFVEQLNSLPVTQLNRLDGILSDLGNHILEIDEVLSETQIKSENLKEKKTRIASLTELEKQLSELSELLYGMVYDSHYMDRTLHALGGLQEDVEKLLKELGRERK